MRNITRAGFLRFLELPEDVDFGSSQFEERLIERMPVQRDSTRGFAQKKTEPFIVDGHDLTGLLDDVEEGEEEIETKSESQLLYEKKEKELDETERNHLHWLVKKEIDKVCSTFEVFDYHTLSLVIFKIIERHKNVFLRMADFYSWLGLERVTVSFFSSEFYEALKDRVALENFYEVINLYKEKLSKRSDVEIQSYSLIGGCELLTDFNEKELDCQIREIDKMSRDDHWRFAAELFTSLMYQVNSTSSEDDFKVIACLIWRYVNFTMFRK